MSGSATIEVPKGLDKLDASEQALFEAMRADDGGADLGAPDPAPAPRAQPKPATTPAPAPEPVDDGGEVLIDIDPEPVDPVAGDNRTRTVPHAQFHAANERRKAAEAKAAAAETARVAAETKLATETARIQERVEILSKLAAMPPAPAAPAPAPVAPPPIEVPDVNVDPVGHFRALAEQQTQRAEQLAQQVKDVTGMVQGLQQGQQQAQQVAEMRNWGVAQEMAFEAREPAYRDAMAFLRQSRHDELEAIGVMDANERERIIGNDVNAIAHRALQEARQGRSDANFAERLFKAAQKRGFAKAAPAPPAADPAAVAAAAIPPLDAEIDPTPPVAVDRATRIAQGRDNATTIGSLGAAPPARLSVEKIANMDERQFAALIKRMEGNPTALRDLMGH